MKKFIKKNLCFIWLLFSSFFLLAILNYFIIRHVKIVPEEKTVLILGDSNMECAINDTIFESSINKSASSDSYFYSYLKLNKILSSKTNIDTVLLSFAPHNIFDNGWLLNSNHIYSRLPLYYPMMSLIDLKFLLFNNTKAVFTALPAIIKASIKNIIKIGLDKNLGDNYGRFLNLDRNILDDVRMKLKNEEPLPFFKIPNSFEVSGGEKKYLDKIIALCEKRKVKLILINTPKRFELLEYSKYGVKEFYRFYDTKYNNIDFIDMSNLDLPDESYGDFVHLNIKGSAIFSNLLKDEGLDSLIIKYGRNKARTHNTQYSQ